MTRAAGGTARAIVVPEVDVDVIALARALRPMLESGGRIVDVTSRDGAWIGFGAFDRKCARLRNRPRNGSGPNPVKRKPRTHRQQTAHAQIRLNLRDISCCCRVGPTPLRAQTVTHPV